MTYIRAFQEELRDMLRDLDEEQQLKIIQVVSKKIVESYRNGQEQGKAPTKLGRRFFGKKNRD